MSDRQPLQTLQSLKEPSFFMTLSTKCRLLISCPPNSSPDRPDSSVSSLNCSLGKKSPVTYYVKRSVYSENCTATGGINAIESLSPPLKLLRSIVFLRGQLLKCLLPQTMLAEVAPN